MLSERIDHNIWVSVDGELQQLRPLVAQLEAEIQRLMQLVKDLDALKEGG